MLNVKYIKSYSVISLLIIVMLSIVIFNQIQKNNLIEKTSTLPVLLALFGILIFSSLTIVLIYFYLNSDKRSTETTVKAKEEISGKKTESKTESKKTIDEQEFWKQLSAKIAEDDEKYFEKILINCSKKINAVQGLAFMKNDSEEFVLAGEYAYFGEEKPKPFKSGEGLSGQVAKNKIALNLTDIPENYITIVSGLGKGSPKNLLIIPLVKNEETIAIVEFASFELFKQEMVDVLIFVSNQFANKL